VPDVLREGDVLGVGELHEQLDPIPQAVVHGDEHLIPARTTRLHAEVEPSETLLRVTAEVGQPRADVERPLLAPQGGLESGEVHRAVERRLELGAVPLLDGADGHPAVRVRDRGDEVAGLYRPRSHVPESLAAPHVLLGLDDLTLVGDDQLALDVGVGLVGRLRQHQEELLTEHVPVVATCLARAPDEELDVLLLLEPLRRGLHLYMSGRDVPGSHELPGELGLTGDVLGRGARVHPGPDRPLSQRLVERRERDVVSGLVECLDGLAAHLDFTLTLSRLALLLDATADLVRVEPRRLEQLLGLVGGPSVEAIAVGVPLLAVLDLGPDQLVRLELRLALLLGELLGRPAGDRVEDLLGLSAERRAALAAAEVRESAAPALGLRPRHGLDLPLDEVVERGTCPVRPLERTVERGHESLLAEELDGGGRPLEHPLLELVHRASRRRDAAPASVALLVTVDDHRGGGALVVVDLDGRLDGLLLGHESLLQELLQDAHDFLLRGSEVLSTFANVRFERPNSTRFYYYVDADEVRLLPVANRQADF